MRGWTGVLALLLLGAAAGGCGPRARDLEQVARTERLVLRFSHVVAENTPKGLAARRFAERVAERSGGRMEVQVYANSSLYGDGEEFSALREGKVQFIAPSTAKLAEIVPQWQVFDLPYLFVDEQAVVRAMTGPAGQALLAQLPEYGFQGLALWDNGFKYLTNRVRPLRRPEDAAGLRFRIQGSAVLREQFAALGASSRQVVFGDLYQVLERGELDGQENTASNIVSKRLYHVQKYMTLSAHGYLGYVVLTSLGWWQSLNPADRQVLLEALAETTAWVRENAPRLNRQALEQVRQSGLVTVHELTPEERVAWAQAMEPVSAWAVRTLGRELLETVRLAARPTDP